MDILNTLVVFIFPILMLISAFYDLLTMRIPNILVGLVTLAFFGTALLMGMGFPGIGWHLAAGAVVLAVTFTFFALGWIGGGDAKLAAGIALWFGFDLLLPFLLYAAIVGGVLTLIILVSRRFMLPASFLRVGWIVKLHNEKTGIPYGIALAAAALMVYPQTPIFKHFADVPSQSEVLFEQLQSL
ncbi:A24 family peptidase [Pelagibacterium sediminicola]|uniref:A24 family peptidase n=1 Tax=Pelagibacterium sediminicola TaxID=2248761 RepID=UPI000E31A0C5|nr:prepilin peptidase [Pelagibacterium sediminicola]